MKRLRWLSLVIFAAAMVLAGGLALSGGAVRADPGLDPERLKDLGAAPELSNDIWINSDKPLRFVAFGYHSA